MKSTMRPLATTFLLGNANLFSYEQASGGAIAGCCAKQGRTIISGASIWLIQRLAYGALSAHVLPNRIHAIPVAKHGICSPAVVAIESIAHVKQDLVLTQ